MGGKGEEHPDLQIIKFLKRILSEAGSSKNDIQYKIKEGRKATQALNSLLWSKGKRVDKEIKIYKNNYICLSFIAKKKLLCHFKA